MRKRAIMELDDAKILANILDGVLKDKFSIVLNKALKKEPKEYLMLDIHMLFESLKECISLELDLVNASDDKVQEIAESEYFLIKLLNTYDLYNLDYRGSKPSLDLIESEFNANYMDLVLHIIYKEQKIKFVIYSKMLPLKARTDFFLDVGLDIVLSGLCIAMFILQLKTYANILVSVLLAIIGLLDTTRGIVKYKEYTQKYGFLKDIKRNKI